MTAARRASVLLLALAAAMPLRAQSDRDLTTLSLEQLLDVTIVGASKYAQKPAEVAAAVSVITRQEIQALGWRTLAQALGSLPGVQTSWDRQYDYPGLRGLALPGDLTARLLVTLDGNRLNDPTYDGGPASRELAIDLDLVERIEYIPGPGSAVYGQNAMFGVVNLVTRSGAAMNGVELSLGAQSALALREGRASWGRRFDNGLDALLSMSAQRARGQDLAMDFGASGISGVAAGLDGERDREFFARLRWGGWSLDVAHGDRRKDDPTASFLSDPLVQGQYARDRQWTGQMQYQGSLGADTLQLTARLFMGNYDFDSILSYGTPFSFPAHGDWRGGELRLVSTALAGHKLMAGIEGQANTHSDQSVLDLADPGNDIHIPNSGWRAGVYLQDEWRIADTLTATLGLRLDRNDRDSGSQASPRVALLWQARPETALKLLYGRAHRAPNAYERDYDDGVAQVANPTLEGETLDTLEAVADHRVGRELSLRASVYRWEMQGLISLVSAARNGIAQYQSGDEVRARGVELSADSSFAGGTRLRGSLAWQQLSQASGTALVNSPRWLGRLALSSPLPWAGLLLGYELRYDSARLSLDGSHLGGYAVSNLQLRTEALASGLALSVGVANLFDKRYAHPAAETNWQNALAQDGRTLRAKLDYRF